MSKETVTRLLSNADALTEGFAALPDHGSFPASELVSGMLFLGQPITVSAVNVGGVSFVEWDGKLEEPDALMSSWLFGREDPNP